MFFLLQQLPCKLLFLDWLNNREQRRASFERRITQQFVENGSGTSRFFFSGVLNTRFIKVYSSLTSVCSIASIFVMLFFFFLTYFK